MCQMAVGFSVASRLTLMDVFMLWLRRDLTMQVSDSTDLNPASFVDPTDAKCDTLYK